MNCPVCDKHELGDGTEDADFDPCRCDDDLDDMFANDVNDADQARLYPPDCSKCGNSKCNCADAEG